jgi:hypothetical protein
MNQSETESAPTSAKAREPEHAYDNPTISATRFLECVMHDPSVKLRHRVDAAAKLLHVLYRDPDYVQREIAKSREPAFVYKIEGITIQ